MVPNKLARLINGKTLKDKVSTKVLLEKANLLSVNQINAKVKPPEISTKYNPYSLFCFKHSSRSNVLNESKATV